MTNDERVQRVLELVAGSLEAEPERWTPEDSDWAKMSGGWGLVRDDGVGARISLPRDPHGIERASIVIDGESLLLDKKAGTRLRDAFQRHAEFSRGRWLDAALAKLAPPPEGSR